LCRGDRRRENGCRRRDAKKRKKSCPKGGDGLATEGRLGEEKSYGGEKRARGKGGFIKKGKNAFFGRVEKIKPDKEGGKNLRRVNSLSGQESRKKKSWKFAKKSWRKKKGE